MAVCVQAFLYTWSKAELQNTSIRLSTSSNRVKDTACQMPVFSLPSHHVQSRPGVPKQAWLRPTLPCSQQGPVPRTLPGRALLFPPPAEGVCYLYRFGQHSQPLTSRHLFTSSMVALLQSLGMAKIPIPEKTRRQREKHVHSWLMIPSGTHTQTPKLKNQYFFMGIVPLCCSASATLYIWGNQGSNVNKPCTYQFTLNSLQCYHLCVATQAWIPKWDASFHLDDSHFLSHSNSYLRPVLSYL